MPTNLLYFNGVDGSTGDYLIPPMAPETLTRIAMGETWDRAHLQELKWRSKQAREFALAPIPGLDPKDLAQVGWGVIFPAHVPESVRAAIEEALGELLEHRKAQAGQHYKRFVGGDGYRRGESKNDFLVRHGARPGPVDPAHVPYYLLIVSDPQTIPYRFQYELDVQYAVGRIHFQTLDEYAQYARSVVLAETAGQVQLPRRAAFFGVTHDRATELSTDYLIKPLAEQLQQDQPSWQVQTLVGAETGKQRLRRLLGGAETPAFLFTASHGMGFPNGDTRQLPYQGALLCQDWSGQRGEIARDHYLAAEDIGDDARLHGLIAFHFACYGAGTPYWDDFAKQAFRSRAAISPHAFLAALPRRLLSHPRGGALAVVGHVERAWSYSIEWTDDAGLEQVKQPVTFQSMLHQLMEGHPIGSALEFLNSSYAEIATMLSGELEEAEYRPPDPFKLAWLWTANNDARGYAIIGDPAVRLVVAQGDTPASERISITPVSHRPGQVSLILDPAALPAAEPAATPVPAPAAGTPAAPAGGAPAPAFEGAVAFGLPGAETLKRIQENLGQALQQLSAGLAGLANDISSLEVATYVSEDMDAVQYDSRTDRFTAGARQRALTRISLDGDMKICVPMNAGELDEALWSIHLGMVQQAQTHRTAMLKAAVEMLTGLMGVPKPE